jgi:hypothetical protein
MMNPLLLFLLYATGFVATFVVVARTMPAWGSGAFFAALAWPVFAPVMAAVWAIEEAWYAARTPRGLRAAWAVVMALACLAVAAALSGCAGGPRPEPAAQIRTVEVPVSVKCAADPGAPPAYADTPQALKAAPDIFGRAKLLLVGRVQRDGWIAQLQAALAGCK